MLACREDRDRKKLVFFCKNCAFEEDAEHGCVYQHLVKHENKGTIILGDMTEDPTLPRTTDVSCPSCKHNEAVYKQQATMQGMDVYYMCCACKIEWRDNA